MLHAAPVMTASQLCAGCAGGAELDILVVHPSVPAKTAKELVDYARANPGKVNFSSGGVGVLPHLIGEWFKSAADIDVVHGLRGGAPSINGWSPARCSSLRRHRHLCRSSRPASCARCNHQRRRIAELPDLPTMIESGFPIRVDELDRALAPARRRAEIAEAQRAVNEAMKAPEFKAALEKLGTEQSAAAGRLAKMIKDDTANGTRSKSLCRSSSNARRTRHARSKPGARARLPPGHEWREAQCLYEPVTPAAPPASSVAGTAASRRWRRELAVVHRGSAAGAAAMCGEE